MIQAIVQKTGGSIRKVCVVLEEARSSFYDASTPTATQLADAGMGDLIEAVFRHHRRRYGYRRLGQELSDRGVTCAPARIRRIMAQRGLRAIQPKTYIPKTSDGRADKPSPNLISGLPLPEVPNLAWAGDITFIPTAAGWLYLAVIIDLCSRRIVGWSLATHMRSDLVLDALLQALKTRSASGAIFHSDHIMPDHVHMLVSIPPKLAVSSVVGYLKGKSAIHVARHFLKRERNYAGQNL
jgi:hypothetical protein